MIDLLEGSPTSPAAPPSHACRADTQSSVRHRGLRKRQVAVLGAAVVVAGAVVISQMRDGTGESTPTAATIDATAADDENGLPVLDLPKPAPAEELPASDGECRADRGDQKSGAGVIAAFNHAYYTQRNGDAARALATPTSSVLPGPELQKVVDAVPVGTNYCLRTVALSGGVYLADLSVMQPAQPVKRGTQTITTVTIDGKWFVDIFT
ncbi:hypothetical protein E143388_07274 [Rhodococcus opacus]|nr:hypothetical protein E143388_07274 [Rhodococcus opacus]